MKIDAYATQGPKGRRTTMWRRALRGLLVIAFMTAGTTAIAASPALAVGACNNDGFPISACIDFGGHGENGQDVRADFYMKASLGDQYYSYRVNIVSQNTVRYKGSGRLNFQGRHCCWYHTTDSWPNVMYSVYSRIDVYNINGNLVLSAYSPTINYIN